MTSTENLHVAIGELAYAVARADGKIQEEEREEFSRIVKQEIRSGDQDFDIAGIIFQVMGKDKLADTATAYDWALKEIRNNSHYLSPRLKQTFINIIEKIARAYSPVTTEEMDLINRFKKDIEPLNGDPIFYAA